MGEDRVVAMVSIRAAQRMRTTEEGRATWHSLSFGAHYDPENVRYGGLLAHNDDHLDPAAGYPDHPHAGVEIVTWVVGGVLVHRDAGGGAADLGAGSLQVQSAGSGIRHSEIADAASGPTRFVQAWVRSDQPDADPSRTAVDAGPALAGGGLVPLASGDGDGDGDALAPLRCAGATLWVARLGPGEEVALPDRPLQHVFVAWGDVDVASARLGSGDALRITDEAAHLVRARGAAEVMVWTFRR